MVKTYRLSEADIYVALAGARGVEVADVDAILETVRRLAGDSAFQLFDADVVAGWRHLFHAAVNAAHAIRGGSAISNSVEVESMLYASCQDQISKAFTLMGLGPSVENVAVLVLSEDPSEAESLAAEIAGRLGVPDDDVMDVTPEKYGRLRDVFDVGDEALGAVGGDPYKALTSLVVEKGALLPLRR